MDREVVSLDKSNIRCRGPQPPGCTAGGERQMSEWSFICRSPPLTLPPEPSPQLSPWKNCLPWNRSLVPKRLGTTAIKHSDPCTHPCVEHWDKCFSLSVLFKWNFQGLFQKLTIAYRMWDQGTTLFSTAWNSSFHFVKIFFKIIGFSPANINLSVNNFFQQLHMVNL